RLGAVAAVVVAARRTGHAAPALVGAAAVGLLSHPFGDVLMAAPPPLLAPVGPALLDGRVGLAADPTVNLLGVLFVEVAAVWLALWTYARLTGRRLRDSVSPAATLGLAFAVAAVALPRPTMASAHLLGFTAVPLAVVLGVSTLRRRRDAGSRGEVLLRAAATGTAALALAAGAYLLAYSVAVRGLVAG
ncbi:hypothetical protein ACFQL9_17230, partial [Halobaculum lipolyticum]